MALTPDKQCESVSTGFRHLDRITGGLRLGQLCTVASCPWEGKTAFAVSLLRNIGVEQKVPTAYFTLKEGELEIMERLTASITGSWEAVPAPSVEVRNAMEIIGFHYRDVETEAAQSIEEAPIWIEDDFDADMDELVGRMERLRQENQVRVVIVDSVSLLMLGRTHKEQTQAIRKLRQTAERLNQAVILTSGTNRDREVRDGCKPPRLGDLCDWGRIGFFSSVVMFVYRPECYYFEIFEEDSDSYDFDMSENGITHL